MSHRLLLILSGLFGVCGISLGALGAHGLQARLLVAGTLSAWKTAVLYHLVHTAALLAVALFASIQQDAENRWAQRAGLWWAAGIVLFSGSLYVLALGGPRWLGPITPIGGVAFIIGWAMLLPAAAKSGR